MLKALIVRDNRYKENWGCRSTSIALSQVIGQDFELLPPIGHLADINRRIPVGDKPDFIDIDFNISVENFMQGYKDNAELGVIYDAVTKADVVVINGEGSYIFCTPYRRDLAFSFFLIELCHRLKKPIFLANSMASDCPYTGSNEIMKANATSQLNKCHGVFLRDQYSHQNILNIGVDKAEYIPDALFSWTTTYKDLYEGDKHIPYKEMFAKWPEDQALFTHQSLPQEYICFSGASFHPLQPLGHWDAFFDKLIERIIKETAMPLLLVMPGGDKFLVKSGEKFNCHVIPGDGNILLNSMILANSRAYVSGRYHPSIMASLGGSPCVFFESNSHKTESLQKVLGYESIVEHKIADDDEVVFNIVEDLKAKLSKGETLRKQIKDVAVENGKKALGLSEKIKSRIS